MVDKPRFARIIKRRLEELDRPARWLADQVAVSEATISRWCNERDTSRIQDNQHVHLLAHYLQLNDDERSQFFTAAGIIWEPPPPPPVLPVTDAEEVYLRTLREECNRLPLAEDERDSPTARKPGQARASLANVYIDLDTTAGPDFDRVCERLRLPVTQRQAMQQELARMGPEVLRQQEAGQRWDELMVMRALAGESDAPREESKTRIKALQRWVKDEEALRQALRPITAIETLAEQPHLVLLGDPGSGKSTFVNHLAFVLAGALLGEDADWAAALEGRFGQPLFPLRIVARRWSGSLRQGDEPGVERVYEALAALPGGMAYEDLRRRLRQTDTMVVFDGLDEAPVAEGEGDYDRRRVLLDSVQAFIVAHPHCRVLVTSRVRPYQTPGYQLDGWDAATLAPLDDPRIEAFVHLWYDEVQRVEGMTPERAAELAGELLAAIGQRHDLHEMAGIPLLLTMLALVNKRYGLPENRAELYDQCTEQLLWEWEKAKAEEGKTQSLDHLLATIDPRRTRQDVEKVLWRLTFEAHQLSGKRDADLKVDDLRKALAETPPQRSENWAWADRLVRFMQQRGGLLTAVYDHTFTFPHRSFQEYLAARHLLELGDADEVIVRLSSDDIWREVILLTCGYLAVKGPTFTWGTLVTALVDAMKLDAQHWRAPILAGIALLEYGPEKVKGGVGRRLQTDLPPLLTAIMQNPALPAASRLEAGLLASDLGDLPADLDAFVDVPGLGYPCRIGKYPVANAQYQRFIAAGGYDEGRPWWTPQIAEALAWDKGWRSGPRYRDNPRFNKATQPVVGVSWYEADAYCQWLAEQWRAQGVIGPDETVRLPTEAEWQAAAGSERYAWGLDFDPANCNSQESGFDHTSPVHMYPGGATPAGVFDLCGNVWEWLQERPGDLAGGAYYRDASGVTAAARAWNDPDYGLGDFGFRCVVVPRSS